MTDIIKITENKRSLMELLLIGDEQESMIERYLDRGDMFVLKSADEVYAVCVITDEGNGVCEIKNIAVRPDKQRQGCGKRLITAVEQHCRGKFKKLTLGTGDSPLTIPFYEQCGFSRSGIICNWFTDNYDHPIFEDGVQLRDMIILEKDLEV